MRLIRIDSCDQCPFRGYNNGNSGYYGHVCDNKTLEPPLRDRHKTHKLDSHRGNDYNIGKSYREIWKPTYEGHFPEWCPLPEI